MFGDRKISQWKFADTGRDAPRSIRNRMAISCIQMIIVWYRTTQHTSFIFLCLPLPSCYPPLLYCNLNVTGRRNLTRTVRPFILPGFHFGMLLTRRRASLSNKGSADLIICAPDMEPSCSTMNFTITRPSILFSMASAGYFIFSRSQLFSAAGPPGKEGCSSTTS